MKQPLLFSALLMGSAIVVLGQQPARAIAIVTDVRIEQTSNGVEVVLETSNGDLDPQFSQIFMVDTPTSLTVDLVDFQLRLQAGNIFHKDNPAPGIVAVTVTPTTDNSIRIVVKGTNGAPRGKISQRDSQGIAFSFQPNLESDAAGNYSVPQELTSQASEAIAPKPKITINGIEMSTTGGNRAAPVLAVAVELSVGTVSVPLADPPAARIRLGQSVRIRRLLLRDVPVIEALSLLAKAVDLNVTFTEVNPAERSPTQTAPVPLTAPQNAKISLDIENEEVENVFNTLLQFSNLQGKLTGQTIYVSKPLPREVDNRIISRSIILNKMPAIRVAEYFYSLGMKRSTSLNQTANNSVCFYKKNLLPSWQGLQVSVDEQNNVLTLSGARQLVESAIEKLRNVPVCDDLTLQNSTLYEPRSGQGDRTTGG